jgi:hypothetical protein
MLASAEPELEAVTEGDEDESEEQYTNGVFSRHRLRYQRSPSISQSSPPFRRRVSPLSSSSVLPSPASTPPSSTTFGRSIYGPTMASYGIHMSANSGGNSLYSLGSDLNNWLSPTSPAGYRNASQTSLDRFSEAESVESVDSFLSSPALEEQTIPGYNLLTHRLIWQELVRTISIAVLPTEESCQIQGFDWKCNHAGYISYRLRRLRRCLWRSIEWVTLAAS